MKIRTTRTLCRIALPCFVASLCLPTFAQAPSPLPVKKVTLFNSGVAYVERIGEVDGNATVPLLFRTAMINDILKSMILLDENGKVQPATYTSRDPIARALQSFAIDVTENLDMPNILSKLRGVKVQIDSSNKGSWSGSIVGVQEKQEAGTDNKPIISHLVILLGDSGLVTVKLDTDKTIKILDERLNKEFKEALGLLASGSDDQRKQVTLHFAGQGKRNVRVGYVAEAPLWKMSYRLMVGGAEKAKPYLQGWALVENTSDEDWNNVSLSLVSGRPVSFIQDLYQPLYIPRPVVPNDVIASPTPQLHAGNVEAKDRLAAVDADAAEMANKQPASNGRMLNKMGSMGRGGLSAGRAMGGGGGSFGTTTLGFMAKESVEAQANGQSAGELFQYNIKSPVNLPRQQAAMIPVIAQDITAEKISIYNADTGAKFPLNAVRVTNNTGQHLKGGPVTLFDEGVYAGDAKMEDIPPSDNRLISYAVDLSVECERQNPVGNQVETSLTIKKGVMTSVRKERQETTYVLKNRTEKGRTVLVEHPFNAEFKLISPEKPAERTPAQYRFQVPIAPSKSASLKVVLERPLSQSFGIMEMDHDTMQFFVNRKDLSQKIRESLAEVLKRKRHQQDLDAQASAKDAEINAIGTDQDRIRKNMAALDKDTALYKRYVSELDQQETHLQTLRSDLVRLRKESAEALKDVRVFVDGLNLE